MKEIPCRKVSCLKTSSLKVDVTRPDNVAVNGNGHPVITTVPPVSPEPCTNPNGVPEVSVAAAAQVRQDDPGAWSLILTMLTFLSPKQGTPWEPYYLGLPGQVTRARRRSVSLRSGDDEGGSDDGDASGASSVSRGPSPTLSPGDAGDSEATRKRSVTFNALVEEVQILPN